MKVAREQKKNVVTFSTGEKNGDDDYHVLVQNFIVVKFVAEKCCGEVCGGKNVCGGKTL